MDYLLSKGSTPVMLLCPARQPVKPAGTEYVRSHSVAAAQERGRARLLSSQACLAHDDKFVKYVSPSLIHVGKFLSMRNA
ncbi:MAG: hypothetical protein DSM106950_22650 [Stigonema ocellatum SAG 48.90 = DSM 106950]|nr:hypothetical protein [Stigonema ocellatum SAG 48.90 = DSM 106950]